MDGREVGAGGHDVVGHLVVGEMAVLPEAFFVERVADALGDAAFDLSGGEDGMEDFADFLQGVEVGDGCGVGGGVDGDFGDVDGPGVGGIGVAAVGFVVPEDVAGGFVAGADFERAVLCEVVRRQRDGSLRECSRGAVRRPTRVPQRDWEARSTSLPTIMAVREATVGPELGTRLVSGWAMRTSLVGKAEGLGGDLAEDGVGALAELGGGDEDAGRPSGVSSISTRELRRRSPEPVKPAPWKKVAKPMPRLMVDAWVFAVELCTFGVVVGFFERAGEQMLHVDRVFEELAGGCAVAGGEEVAAAQLFRGEADDLGDLVHVAFEREDALRSAEAAEGSVGRDVGGDGFGADGEVGPVIRAGRVDGAAGEDDGRERHVGAAVDGEVDLAGEEFAVFADGGAMAGAGGVALGGGGHVFGAVVAELDRMAGLHGEQRGVAADDGGEVFLAAEGSAGLGLDDAAFFCGEVEDQFERVDQVVRALHGACVTVTTVCGIVLRR